MSGNTAGTLTHLSPPHVTPHWAPTHPVVKSTPHPNRHCQGTAATTTRTRPINAAAERTPPTNEEQGH
jgi:hypothetical protein